jgi:hypothetical protein
MSIGHTVAVYAAHDLARGLLSRGVVDGDDPLHFVAMRQVSRDICDAVAAGLCESAAGMYEGHGGARVAETKMRDHRSRWFTVIPTEAEGESDAARRHWAAARRYVVPSRVHVFTADPFIGGDAVKRPKIFGGNWIADSYEASKYFDNGAHDPISIDESVALSASVADTVVLVVPHGSLNDKTSSGHDLALRHLLGATAAMQRGRHHRTHIVEVALAAPEDGVSRDAKLAATDHKAILELTIRSPYRAHALGLVDERALSGTVPAPAFHPGMVTEGHRCRQVVCRERRPRRRGRARRCGGAPGARAAAAARDEGTIRNCVQAR